MKRIERINVVMASAVLAVVLIFVGVLMLLSGGRLWDKEGVFASAVGTEESVDELLDDSTEPGIALVSDDPTQEASVVSDDSGSGNDSQSTGDGEETGEGDNVKIGSAFDVVTGAVENLEGDFILTYTFYNKSNGTDNWDNFVVEIRNDTYTWFDVRADNYGWLWTQAAGFITDAEENGITFGNGASDWDVWADLMRQGQGCTVYVIRQDTTVTVITESAGDTFYARVTLDDYADGCPLYVHLTGESCRLENVSYSIKYITEWDSDTLNWVSELIEESENNNEGGATAEGGATLDGTTYTSTAWWTGVTGEELSISSAYATWNYTILVESSISDFGIEVYNSDGSKYITTLTNGDGWYYGDTLEANDLVISGTSISDNLERGKLYYVIVERQDTDFTIYYMDSSGEILLAFFATDTNMDDTAYVHFYAEYGTFVVASSVTEDEAPVVDTQSTDNNTTTVTDDTEIVEEESEADEDTEDVEEDNGDDDDDDDDYDIEDLDGDDDSDDSDGEDDDEYSESVVLQEASYSSTAWWSGSYGSESAWVGDAVWVYAVTVDKTSGDDAFSVEIYDEDGNYITLNSDGTCWYYGTTGEDIVVSGDPIVLEAGRTYIVVVSREGENFFAEFHDEDGNELLSFYAGNTSIADIAISHFYAQIGEYTVDAESSGNEPVDMDELDVSVGGTGRSSIKVSGARTADAPISILILEIMAGFVLIGWSIRTRA